jgi:hypothetical protein
MIVVEQILRSKILHKFKVVKVAPSSLLSSIPIMAFLHAAMSTVQYLCVHEAGGVCHLDCT